MPDFLGWLFLALWVFAIICCTELGWRIPVVRDILFQASERADRIARRGKE